MKKRLKTTTARYNRFVSKDVIVGKSKIIQPTDYFWYNFYLKFWTRYEHYIKYLNVYTPTVVKNLKKYFSDEYEFRPDFFPVVLIASDKF